MAHSLPISAIKEEPANSHSQWLSEKYEDDDMKKQEYCGNETQTVTDQLPKIKTERELETEHVSIYEEHSVRKANTVGLELVPEIKTEPEFEAGNINMYEERVNISNLISDIIKNKLSSDSENSDHEMDFEDNYYLENHDSKTSEDDIELYLENAFRCSECDSKFHEISLLEKHLKDKHIIERPISCSLCGCETVTEGLLDTIDQEQKHVCVQCTDRLNDETVNNKSYTKKKKQNKISNFKSPQKRTKYNSETGCDTTFLECALCNYKTQVKKNLRRHIVRHDKNYRYACSDCDYKCRDRHHLAIHVQKHSNCEKVHACKICDYKTNAKSYLISHLRSHTAERPFACTLCDYKAIKKAYLNRHYKSHTGERPYLCTECDYKAAETSTLNRHMRMHYNVKPYECAMCDYKSTEKSKLRRHLMNHMKKKESFACGSCDYVFLSRTGLSRHFKETH